MLPPVMGCYSVPSDSIRQETHRNGMKFSLQENLYSLNCFTIHWLAAAVSNGYQLSLLFYFSRTVYTQWFDFFVIVTVHNSSCGKVMFLYMSVILVTGVGLLLGPGGVDPQADPPGKHP